MGTMVYLWSSFWIIYVAITLKFVAFSSRFFHYILYTTWVEIRTGYRIQSKQDTSKYFNTLWNLWNVWIVEYPAFLMITRHQRPVNPMLPISCIGQPYTDCWLLVCALSGSSCICRLSGGDESSSGDALARILEISAPVWWPSGRGLFKAVGVIASACSWNWGNNLVSQRELKNWTGSVDVDVMEKCDIQNSIDTRRTYQFSPAKIVCQGMLGLAFKNHGGKYAAPV